MTTEYHITPKGYETAARIEEKFRTTNMTIDEIAAEEGVSALDIAMLMAIIAEGGSVVDDDDE